MKTLAKIKLSIVNYQLIIIGVILLIVNCSRFGGISCYAGPPIHSSSAKKATPAPAPLSGCSPGAAQTDLDVNNVRARFLMGGDMWWDYSDATRGRYEVPYNPHETTPGPMPIYAGALWIGGMDQGGQLRLAGQEYRGGNDWWPGPLDTTGGAATISAATCQQYDQHYKITQAEVAAFIGGGPTTSAISNWPGNGNTSIGQANYLAPFFDKNGDGIYKPADGDYPGFDLVNGDNACALNNCIPADHLFGDQCLWWVINDKGNIHTNTNGTPMGLEVHCQAFGFSTDDEINSMTFVNYRIYNRSSLELDSTYIGQWCDPDLGGGLDDHVGCDVARGLGYVYNELNNDLANGAEIGYGVSPPACGIDFFRGPIATPGDGVDNNHNCVIDEPCEQEVMTHFTYFSNNGGADPHSDPLVAKEYYNYLSGSWKDGSAVVYGGSGWANSAGATTTPAAFVYPWNPANGQNSDPIGWSVGGNCANHVAAPVANWWDPLPGNPAGDDRRFVESAGPFKLMPGAVNVVTVGVVWARSTGGNLASINLMLAADDKAQKLFDNCFQVLNGPDAPDLTIQELDNKLILYVTNKPTSNNYNENYREYDPSISLTNSHGALHCIDTAYHFEGYRIFQLKDGTISSGDLFNSDGSVNSAKAHQIAQCDVKNGVSTIVNYVFNQGLGASVPMTEVQGADNGIFHSLVITKDDFNGTPLINHKTYFFMATAYGYNNFKTYKQDGLIDTTDNKCPFSANYTPAMDGQKKPYKQGRKNIQSYSAIPHTSTPYTGGTEMTGSYGSGPMITRVEGNGNGGMTLDMVQSSMDQIFTNGNADPSNKNWRVLTPTYLAGKGPLSIKVVDPLNVPEGNAFTLKFDTLPVIAYKTSSLVGKFNIGETVKGSTSNATGVIVNNYTVSITNSILQVKNLVGTFKTGEFIKGTGDDSVKSVSKIVDNAAWSLINNTTGAIVTSDKTIQAENEQLVLQYGLAFSITQPLDPGNQKAPNGFLEASMSPASSWLTGQADDDLSTYANWIRSGTAAGDYLNVDDDQVYEGILGGTWAPYRLTACNATFNPAAYYTGPGLNVNYLPYSPMTDLASVNVVFTSDQSKWTRCDVLEMCESVAYSQGGARKFDKRIAPSVDKNGNPDGTTNTWGPAGVPSTGMGWFPGYAINIETGERLNMAFGENSALSLREGAIITYNVRDNITYGSLQGAFISSPLPEKITSYAPTYTVDATAKIVSDNGSAMVIESVTGTIASGDIIIGATSGTKAIVSLFTADTFLVTETVKGGTSGATGVILANKSGSMNITTITGTFVPGEIITGQTTLTTATITAYTSYKQDDNGRDMKWNPTSKSTGPAPWSSTASVPVFGGQHYIYVFGHNNKYTTGPTDSNLPRYDAGKFMDSLLSTNGGQPQTPEKRSFFRSAMWVNIPLLKAGHNLLESDVTVRLRVVKTYKKGYATSTDTATTSQNKNLPMYTFGTEDIATHTHQNDLAVSALDVIGVVPNPYYAYSAYEKNNLDNIIKITNLPEQCTISIYNLGGTLVRRLKKGEAVVNLTPKSSNSPTTWSDGSLDWDLKNTAGTPISSGVYIIHVEVPGVGEKVVKWFGVMRPVDLGSF